MTPAQARRRLRSYLRWRQPVTHDNLYEAIQMGYEALAANLKTKKGVRK